MQIEFAGKPKFLRM